MKVFYVVNKDNKTMDGCGYYRNYLPALYLTASGNHDCKLSNQFRSKAKENKETKSVDVFFDITFIMESDIIVLSRYYEITDFPMIKSFIDAAHHYGKKVVYETDDNLFDIPEHNQVRGEAIKARELILYMMRNCDAYTVTTERLGRFLNTICEKPTYVLPNSVEFDSKANVIYKGEIPEKKEGVIRIGWTGGGTHIKDLAAVSGALKRIVKNHNNVEFMSLCSTALDQSVFDFKHNHIDLVPVEIYHEVLNDMNLDIAVCPLIGDKFNSGKSAIKWTEYSMCAVPTIYSAVAPYSDIIEDGITGLGVYKNTKNSWIEALEKLIFDEDLRGNLRANAYNKVYNDFNMEYNFLLWEKAYTEVLKNEPNNTNTA